MIRDVSLGKPKAPPEGWKEKLQKYRKIKDRLRQHKLGLPKDDIDVKDIPF